MKIKRIINLGFSVQMNGDIHGIDALFSAMLREV